MDKYLVALIISLLILPVLISRIETIMFWRRFTNQTVPKDYRKKEYKMLLIFWLIFTIAVFIYYIFFVD